MLPIARRLGPITGTRPLPKCGACGKNMVGDVAPCVGSLRPHVCVKCFDAEDVRQLPSIDRSIDDRSLDRGAQDDECPVCTRQLASPAPSGAESSSSSTVSLPPSSSVSSFQAPRAAPEWWRALSGDSSPRPPPLRRRRTSDSGCSAWDAFTTEDDAALRHLSDELRREKKRKKKLDARAAEHPVLALNRVMDVSGLSARHDDDDGGEGARLRALRRKLQVLEAAWRQEHVAGDARRLETVVAALVHRMLRCAASAPKSAVEDGRVLTAAMRLVQDVLVGRTILYQAKRAASARTGDDTEALCVTKVMDDAVRLALVWTLEHVEYYGAPGSKDKTRAAADVMRNTFGHCLSLTSVRRQVRNLKDYCTHVLRRQRNPETQEWMWGEGANPVSHAVAGAWKRMYEAECHTRAISDAVDRAAAGETMPPVSEPVAHMAALRNDAREGRRKRAHATRQDRTIVHLRALLEAAQSQAATHLATAAMTQHARTTTNLTHLAAAISLGAHHAGFGAFRSPRALNDAFPSAAAQPRAVSAPTSAPMSATLAGSDLATLRELVPKCAPLAAHRARILRIIDANMFPQAVVDALRVWKSAPPKERTEASFARVWESVLP